MPIRGDRLRWPPRPGRTSRDSESRNAAHTGTRSSLRSSSPRDEQSTNPNQPLRQPDERDQSADRQSSAPRKVMQQAHDDLESAQQDTDCRSQTAEVLARNSDALRKPQDER